MKLNAGKCKLMSISRSNSPKPTYTIGTHILEHTDQYKYLGVIISRNLSWKEQTKAVVSKASRMVGFVRRVVKTRVEINQ